MSENGDNQALRRAGYENGEKTAHGFRTMAATLLNEMGRMYKEYPPGAAPTAMKQVAGKIRAADAFAFVTGEYNRGQRPGLKNLIGNFLEEWYCRPAAIASYSAGWIAFSQPWPSHSSSAWPV